MGSMYVSSRHMTPIRNHGPRQLVRCGRFSLLMVHMSLTRSWKSRSATIGKYTLTIRGDFLMIRYWLTPCTKLKSQYIISLELRLRASWISIAYHLRRGRRTNRGSPGKASVIVTCQTGSIARFDLIEEPVKLVLDIVPVEIHLEILPGHIPLLVDSPCLGLCILFP